MALVVLPKPLVSPHSLLAEREVDHASPLAALLFFLGVATGAEGDGALRVLTRLVGAVGSTAVGAASSPTGPAAVFVGGSSSQLNYSNALPGAAFAATGYTLAVWWEWDGVATGGYGSPLALGGGNFAIQAHGDSSGMGAVTYDGSTYLITSQVPMQAGVPCLFVARSNAAVGTDFWMFRSLDARLLGSTSPVAGGLPSGMNTAVTVGNNPNGSNYIGGRCIGAAGWSRYLGVSEMRLLALSPAPLLRPQSPAQRYWFEIGGSGALAVALPVGAFASGIASLTAAALTASSPLGAFANGITSAGGGATTDALSLGAVVGGIGSSSGAALANALPAGAFASGLGTASTGAGVQINALSLGGFVGGIGSVRGGATVTGISIGGFAAGSGKFAAGASTLAVPSGAFAAGLGTASTGTTVQVNALSLGAFASGLGFVGADAAVAAMSSGSFTYGLSSISAGTTLSALPSGAFASGVATPIISVSLSITPLGAVASAIGDVSSGAVLVSTPRGAFGAGTTALTATAALNAVPLGAFVAGVSTAAVIGAITIGCVSVIDGIVTTISVSDGSC